jgi:RNA polymerase sigma-70 factor, ECF subfamily
MLHSAMQDADIVRGLRNGDQELFSKLLELYQVSLVKLCKGFLHNEEDARDVVQDTFIEVFESIHQFREDARLSTWLYRIAVNKSLNFLRKNRFNHWIVSLDFLSDRHRDEQEQLINVHGTEQSDTLLEQKERTRQIRQAVDSLPENQRIAFILNKYQDLNYKEIADVMEVSLSAVESLLHRAKLNLRKKLFLLYKKKLS